MDQKHWWKWGLKDWSVVSIDTISIDPLPIVPSYDYSCFFQCYQNTAYMSIGQCDNMCHSQSEHLILTVIIRIPASKNRTCAVMTTTWWECMIKTWASMWHEAK
jgi:hypothetical protein